ncbi:MAG TPA: redox-regulated ATPase YchF [Ruminococcaceae bacterium]|nr:redox-regulated ATPase YchF [Oscillospiraceae bacterium]
MKLGIVGLPNVGKSTLFNAITNAGAESANYPFCTIEPNVGVVAVPDERLDVLTKMYDAVKTTHAVIEFVDIAGLVKGASKGEGLGNKFLSHIREVDAIIHVVRCFDGTDVIHVEGSIDPVRDMGTINLELILSDLEIVDRRLDKDRKLLKGNKKYEAEISLLERLKATLEAENPARSMERTEDENELVTALTLLSEKPVIYAANLSEEDFENGIEKNTHYQALRTQAEKEHAGVLPICAQMEEDLSSMEEEEKHLFLEDLGLKESGLDRLIKESYRLLGLISYLTAGKPEVRAWTIVRGTKAPQAAGKIHSDFERGFIRAEVIPYHDLVECHGLALAKEKGLVRSEGKDYVVQDGDVILFRFNV